jgi:hypothetical protein
MKKLLTLSFLSLVIFKSGISQPVSALSGAFSMRDQEGDHAMIMQDNYYMHAVYNIIWTRER